MYRSVNYNFTGQTCVVTGAGRGLGRVAAGLFLKAGARVAYLSRTPYPDVLTEVNANQDRAFFFVVDVSDSSQVKTAFQQVQERFGSIDILVNNAGIAKAGSIEDVSSEAWDAVMGNNVRSYFLCIQSVAPSMKKQTYGRIVNVSSVAGRDKSLVLGAPYTASKAAVIGLTKQAAAELGPYGITVNCICPSQHWTPMLESVLTPETEQMLLNKIPLGYIAKPEQIADVILFLASDGASYMNGAIVDVNGGLW